MKQSLTIAAAATLLLSGCAWNFQRDVDGPVCAAMAAPVSSLTDALLDHPETSQEVGHPAVDIIVIHNQGC